MRTALFTLAYVGLAAYCISDALQHRDHEPFGLPKVLWVIIILLFPYLGAAAWLMLVFRTRQATPPRRDVAPDDDPEYLTWLREQERRRKLGN